jgi:transcriptional regulator with XRE-family HTH domain
MSLDELAARVGATRRQVISYEQGHVVPEPARLVALAAAVAVDVTVLTGVPAADADLTDLRRHAGLTLKAAAARVRSSPVAPTVRCSAWLLGELEAGRVPAMWSSPEIRDQVVAALATIYTAPPERLAALWPADTDTDTDSAVDSAIDTVVAANGTVPDRENAETEADVALVPTYRLVGPSWDTWYARCPHCSLISPPSSASIPINRDDSIDWRTPAQLRCSQCGSQHKVTVDQLAPHDAVITCLRSTCAREFAAPREAVEAVCEYCHLINPGPAALADDQVRLLAATVRYDHTLQMQARLAAAKARAQVRGGDDFLLTPGQ